jgi:hypothetical protein
VLVNDGCRKASAKHYARYMSADPCREMLFRTWIAQGIRLVLSALVLCQSHGYAQSGPQPPCGREPVPSYPGPGDQATVKIWSKSDFGRDWKPPACTGWTAPGFASLVTTVARFQRAPDAGDLLRHIGAISDLAGVRYWSITHKAWQTLIVEAHALTGSQLGQRREDFKADEMNEGKVLYFEQADNLSGTAIYQMHIAEASTNRIVFDIENVSAMRDHFITIFPPGELQSIYFLDRESEDAWRFYSMVRTGKNASWLAGNESSAINRAVAFYRHVVGIPTDQEPPVAR